MTRIGHYEVGEKLGEGGMGVVYRARDSKLGRDVALKVLHPAVADDPERLARLQREAQVLAALNHPNIAHIYGIEGTALVMEYVPGETLRGPLPVDEAMAVARQIADALEAAHEKGIVHRDLKPGNVKVTPDGTVKVLDFGLAKALAGDPQTAVTLANSPTLSMAATRAGMILGTASYMSPEQARGRTIDRRTDVWAFGCVLYELLTGKQCFGGETVTDALAAIVTKEPDWSALPPGSPVELLRLCLQKDPKQRLRDIGDAALVTGTVPGQAQAPAPGRQSAIFNLQSVISWALILVLTISLAVLWKNTRPVARPLQRFNVELGTELGPAVSYGAAAIISPDGSRVVFAGRGPDGKTRLYTRLLDQAQASPLVGTEDPRDPFFSPDGQWVAFFAEGKLKKTTVQGGAPINLCDAFDARGGSWGEDGQILFAPDTRSGLLQVPSAGGSPKPATELRKDHVESTHRWPQVVSTSQGQAVLFTVASGPNYDESHIDVQLLSTGRRATLQRGATYGRFLPSSIGNAAGHLVYVHQGTLFAAPMDLGRLELTGPASPAVEGVVCNTGNGGAQFSFSQTGILTFLSGGESGGVRTLVWLDSAGKTSPLRAGSAPQGRYFTPRLSPDGKRIALTVAGVNMDLWVYEWERDTMSRLTFAPEADSYPVWSPGSKHIVFSSMRGGSIGSLYWMRADGAGDAVRLTESAYQQFPFSISPDGKWLAYQEQRPESSWDLWIMPLDLSDPDHPKPGKPEPFLVTPTVESQPRFSSDGRWLAYASQESGASEVYVRPFPGPGGKWQISTGGGLMPVWSPNGRELFYRTQDSRIMVAEYTTTGDTFTAGKPRLWSERRFFDTGTFPNFDIAPGGKRFLVMAQPSGEGQQKPSTQLVFLLNFTDELRRKAK